MLYAGNILDKAREVFAAAIKHRPRIRLTIRQRGQVLELPMSTREQRRLTHPTKKASSDTEEKAFSFLSIKLGDAEFHAFFDRRRDSSVGGPANIWLGPRSKLRPLPKLALWR